MLLSYFLANIIHKNYEQKNDEKEICKIEEEQTAE